MKNETQNILNPAATSLNVLVVYDDLAAGLLSKDLYDRLVQRFDPACPFTLIAWSLSALTLPELARAAADDAAKTDLLIVAVNGETILPSSIKSWISRSVRRVRSHAGALVAQLHGIVRTDQEITPAYGCLKHIAEDFGVDFFSEVVEPVGEKLDNSIEGIHKRAHMSSPVLDALLQLK